MTAFEFTKNEDGTVPLDQAIREALGAASVAWSDGTRGEFQEARVRQIAEALEDRVAQEILTVEEQYTGGATEMNTLAANAVNGLRRAADAVDAMPQGLRLRVPLLNTLTYSTDQLRREADHIESTVLLVEQATKEPDGNEQTKSE